MNVCFAQVITVLIRAAQLFAFGVFLKKTCAVIQLKNLHYTYLLLITLDQEFFFSMRT